MGQTWHCIDKNESESFSSPAYTEACFKPWIFQKLVDAVAEKLVEFDKTTPVDAVAASGNSGLLLASALSYKLGIPVIAVRKTGDRYSDAEGYLPRRGRQLSYVIVDDLISGGMTISNIVRKIRHATEQPYSIHSNAACVAIFLYEAEKIGPFVTKEQEKEIPIVFVNRYLL